MFGWDSWQVRVGGTSSTCSGAMVGSVIVSSAGGSLSIGFVPIDSGVADACYTEEFDRVFDVVSDGSLFLWGEVVPDVSVGGNGT